MNRRRRRSVIAGLLLMPLLAAAVLAASTAAVTADAPPARSAAVALVLGGFAIMCVLPLVPGLWEVLQPRDRYPLPVNLDYAKDPRYLGNSLRRLLNHALAAGELAEGVYRVNLSQPESVRLSGNLTLAAGETCPQVLVVRGDLNAGDGVVCEREVYATGRVTMAADAGLRALAADGDIDLGPRVSVLRWLDTAGDLRAAREGQLGRHCCAQGRLELADGCRFARLYGAVIVTPGGRPRPAPAALTPQIEPPAANQDPSERTIAEVLHYERGDLGLAAGQTLQGDLVVYGNLTVAAGATLAGSLRVRGSVDLAAGVTLLGSLFADGPVNLGQGVTVAGHVFGQDTVTLAPDVQIGRDGAVKSLVGNRGVTLGERVVVHGYVQTEGEGRVRCSGG
ncbi:MAG: hypothetical protein RBT60_09520 [Candidatus Krumholzibacteria bacterium]|jgi:cytoskeletal protein CcmA (bactofilin family)|nr:hypothetical protein [Candidatus Krumholzibacteria bacterium]